jgi:hypothetical protein
MNLKPIINKTMESFGKIMFGILMLVIGIIISGIMMMLCWSWFIVPVFTTLPILTFGQSIGISMFLAVLKYRSTKKDKEKEFEEIIADFFTGLFEIGFLFLIVWITYIIIR